MVRKHGATGKSFSCSIFLGYDYQSETVCSTIARGDFFAGEVRNHPSIKN